MSFGKDRGAVSGHGMGHAVSIAVSAEPRLLDLGKILQKVVIRSRGFDDLVEGSRIRCSQGGGNGVSHSVVYKAKDPLALEVHS